MKMEKEKYIPTHLKTQEDGKELLFGKNLRLRSKLSMIVKRKAVLTRKLADKQTDSIAEEWVEVKQEKWTKPQFVNVGKIFHGFSNSECRKLQRKAGTFCSLHQLLELKSGQMSKSYLKESQRICFDPIDIQLKKFDYCALQELNRKGSLPSEFGRDRRMVKLEMKDRPLSDLDGRFKLSNGDLAINTGIWLRMGASIHTPRYHGSLHTFSVASKTPSLPTITADESQEEDSQFISASR